MISFGFNLFFKKIFKGKSFWAKCLFELLSIALTMSVIYYASESFLLKANEEKMSLFVFLLVGEVALVVPMSFAERLLSNFLEIRHQHFYHTLIGLRLSPISFIITKAFTDTVFPLMRVLFIIMISVLFLEFRFTALDMAIFFGLQFFAVAIFASMALIASLIYLKSNRGIGFFYTLQSFSAIIGGVYFPVKIFPSYVKNISLFLPQTHILQASRLIFNGQNLEFKMCLIIIAWTIFLLGLWLRLDRFFVSHLKNKARYF